MVLNPAYGKLGYSVNYRHYGTLMVIADNGINFPITQPFLLIDYHRAIINADPVPDLASLVFGTVPLLSLSMTNKQILLDFQPA